MKIILGCDHGGLDVKNAVVKFLKKRGKDEVVDLGTQTAQSVDYPDYAISAAEAVVEGRADVAILVCTTGIGMSITANRFAGVRAALCDDVDRAKLTRSHNNANVLSLSGKLAVADALKIVEAFLDTPFSGEERHQRRLDKLERGERVSEIAYLAGADKAVYDAIKGQLHQEDTTINLIASENTVSRAVRVAAGSVLTNKYAEGYPAHRWYSGCLPVDAAETLAIERAKQLFGAEHANVQPHCGSSANMAVYFSVLNPGDTIMSMSLDQGGHLSHGSPVNFSGKLYHIVPYGVSKETEMLDYDEIEKQALAVKPQLILAGASAYPRVIDFKRFREIADKVGAYFMVDMAHIAGLVAGGMHPSPVPYADFVTTTTHKTLRGPRGGLVLCKEKFAKQLDKAVFPGMQGGPLENIVAAKAVCFGEALQPEFKDYAKHIVLNCKALADIFLKRGFHLVSGGTDNHLLLVNVAKSGLTGKVAAAALDAAGIICNKNTIPFDTNSPFVTSGIRIGTASVTTRGMREAEMKKIGGWICDILSDAENVELQKKVHAEVSELVAMFPVPEEKMTRKKIYLSGPIMDEAPGQASPWRERAKAQLQDHFVLLDPMRRSFKDREVDSANEIVEFDLQDVRDADILLVNYDRPSIGTSMEVFFASHDLGKFTVAFSHFPFKECSPWMVRYCTKILPSLEAAIIYIRENFITRHVE